MKTALVLFVAAALAACGAETVGTAATAGALKKQELEQGQKTLQQAEQRIDRALQQMQARPGAEGR